MCLFKYKLSKDEVDRIFNIIDSDQNGSIEYQEFMRAVCDKNKLDGRRCNGAPDFIIEIVSPGNPADDYIRKLYYYKNAGVREYWIVDAEKSRVSVRILDCRSKKKNRYCKLL